MNNRAVFHLISYTLGFISLFLGGCWLVSVHFDDPAAAQHALAVSAGITFICAAIMWGATRGRIDLSRRDGFGIVTFGWLGASLFGCLPFLLSGVVSHPVDALFETMSGFTTTGASVLTDLESLPKGILFWRALTQWIGGMGVLVLCVAILPFLGVGGMQIYRAEMPGPSKDRLTPRIARTAEYLWGVYVVLSLLEILLLRLGGLSWFDACCHTFATISTGGFSTRTDSVGAFNSAYMETVVVVFMLLSAINFALHFRAIRGQPLGYARDPECRAFLTIWGLGCLALTASIWGRGSPSLTESLRAAVFQCTSILTTTGFATADFNAWPNVARTTLLLLMFIGGCAGSTAGSMKIIRVMVITKMMVRELRTTMLPRAVIQVKVGGNVVERDVAANIGVFFIIFVLVFSGATVLMSLWMPNLVSAASSVIASLGNIGPGLDAVGPTATFASVPAPGKLVLTACMLLGRLELFTVLIMLMPGFWRK